MLQCFIRILHYWILQKAELLMFHCVQRDRMDERMLHFQQDPGNQVGERALGWGEGPGVRRGPWGKERSLRVRFSLGFTLITFLSLIFLVTH